MTCTKCGNKNPKKVFIAGLTPEKGKVVGCDKCKSETKK